MQCLVYIISIFKKEKVLLQLSLCRFLLVSGGLENELSGLSFLHVQVQLMQNYRAVVVFNMYC